MVVAFLMGETFFFVSYLDTCVRDGSNACVCCQHCLPESTLCLWCDLHINSPTNSSWEDSAGEASGHEAHSRRPHGTEEAQQGELLGGVGSMSVWDEV